MLRLTDPGCDTDDDDYDDEQDDEQKTKAKQCHVLWRKRQELVVIRALCTVKHGISITL